MLGIVSKDKDILTDVKYLFVRKISEQEGEICASSVFSRTDYCVVGSYNLDRCKKIMKDIQGGLSNLYGYPANFNPGILFYIMPED